MQADDQKRAAEKAFGTVFSGGIQTSDPLRSGMHGISYIVISAISRKETERPTAQALFQKDTNLHSIRTGEPLKTSTMEHWKKVSSMHQTNVSMTYMGGTFIYYFFYVEDDHFASVLDFEEGELRVGMFASRST